MRLGLVLLATASLGCTEPTAPTQTVCVAHTDSLYVLNGVPTALTVTTVCQTHPLPRKLR